MGSRLACDGRSTVESSERRRRARGKGLAASACEASLVSPPLLKFYFDVLTIPSENGQLLVFQHDGLQRYNWRVEERE